MEQIDRLLDGLNFPVNENSLERACREGNLLWCQCLIQTGIDVNFNSNTPIIVAASNDHIDIVRLLLRYVGNLSIFAIAGAIHNKHNNVFNFLINYQDFPVADLTDLLHVAIQSFDDDLYIVRTLVDKGADVSHENNQYCILDEALQTGKYTLVKYLLDVGADIHGRDDRLIFTAVNSLNYDIVQLMVDHGFDMRSHESLALMLSTKDQKMLELVIELGCDIHAQKGKVLLIAVDNDASIETIRWLLDHGCVERMSKAFNTALLQRNIELMKLFIEKGYVIDSTQLLNNAIQTKNRKIVQLVLSLKPSINENDMEAALNIGDAGLVRLLLDYGAIPTRKMLRIAIWNVEFYMPSIHKDILKLLLEYGADPTTEIRHVKDPKLKELLTSYV
jgi:ankyrin repeat protein